MKYNYYYTVEFDIDAYTAYVPAFKATVMDDNLPGLEKAIEFSIESAIQICEEEGRPVPPEDGDIYASGKIALRVPKSLHRKLISQSRMEGVSMNQLIVSKLAA